MKTFKLKSLKVIHFIEKEIVQEDIPLIDGLIINREDEENQWVIEAFTEKEHLNYFKKLQEFKHDVIIEVKITKKSNDPALFITSIIGLNEIETHMNVLFKGIIIDLPKDKIEEYLRSSIQDNLKGEELIVRFKEQIKKV